MKIVPNLYLEIAGIVLLVFWATFLVSLRILHFKKIASLLISSGLILIIGFGFFTVFLNPAPQIISISPGSSETGVSLNRGIEIVFSMPISRPMLNISMTPHVPGQWVYDQDLIPRHLMRRLRFIPSETLPPDTEFQISLKGIQNVRRTSAGFDYDFRFSTQESPKVAKVTPGNNEKSVSPDTKIEVYLTAPNGSLSQINFDLLPRVPFTVSEDTTKTHLTITPSEPLSQGTSYHLSVTKADLTRDLATNEVIHTGIENQIFSDNFTVKEAAGIDSFTPVGNKVTSRQPVTIRFSRPMVESEVRQSFSITPAVEGSSLLIDGVIFVFTPKKYDFNTTYSVRIARGTHAVDGSFLPDDVVHTFSTLGNVVVEKITPRDSAEGVDVRSPIKIYFDQDVVPDSLKGKLTINPPVSGTSNWEGSVLTYAPDNLLSFSTKYTVTVKKGVKAADGLDSIADFTASFTTEPESVVNEVPVYLQQHSLSCEVAALRMSLAYRKIAVPEDTLINQIGFDSTAHRGNIWGDPYKAFVGSIDGRQMSSGYGVYWGPINRVANLYRPSEEFSGWSVGRILTEVKKGNPVIIWTYASNGAPAYWFTPLGEKIYAVAGEHAVVVVGFVGSVEQPTAVLVNDPLEGRVTWDRGTFEKRLSAFVGSGVVVY